MDGREGHGLNCISKIRMSKSYYLTHSVTVFGDRALKEVIMVKWSHKGEP